MKKSLFALLTVLIFSLTASISEARGRKPEADDSYPDYNKLDMRRKSQDATKEDSQTKGQETPPALPSSPALSTPKKWEPVDDSVPVAPPKAVYMPDDASEPPMPDSIKDTLIQGATAQ